MIQTATPETSSRTAPAARIPFQRPADRPKLDDLWFLLGSRCNLRCIHCYVGSSPENGTIEPLTAVEVERFLAEGLEYGLSRSYFTGGEPFVNPHILELIPLALEAAPLTILTNATKPLGRCLDEVASIAAGWEPGRLSFRVSLDHYDEARHDAIRGTGKFRETVGVVRGLIARGFRPIVTLTGEVFRGNPAPQDRIVRRMKNLFLEGTPPAGGAAAGSPAAGPRPSGTQGTGSQGNGAAIARGGDPVEVKVLPHVLPMGTQESRLDEVPRAVAVTPRQLEDAGVRPEGLMCANGRSVLKLGGEARVYPCPIIYDVPAFHLGGTLAASFEKDVPLTHVGCGTYCCRPTAGRCTN